MYDTLSTYLVFISLCNIGEVPTSGPLCDRKGLAVSHFSAVESRMYPHPQPKEQNSQCEVFCMVRNST